MKSFYLVLAIVGAIIPLVFFTQFFLGSGGEVAPLDFVPALFVNAAAGGFAGRSTSWAPCWGSWSATL